MVAICTGYDSSPAIYMSTEYNIDCSEEEILCRYSNSRAPGGLPLKISTRVRHLLNDCECWPVHNVEFIILQYKYSGGLSKGLFWYSNG